MGSVFFIAAMWLDQGKLPFYAGICAWATYYSKNYHNACTCTFRAVFQFTQNGQKNRYKLWLITESSLNEKTHHFRWTAKRLDGMRLRSTAPHGVYPIDWYIFLASLINKQSREELDSIYTYDNDESTWFDCFCCARAPERTHSSNADGVRSADSAAHIPVGGGETHKTNKITHFARHIEINTAEWNENLLLCMHTATYLLFLWAHDCTFTAVIFIISNKRIFIRRS